MWVYAIGAGPRSPVKIGRTADPVKRLKALQTGNHERLSIIAAWPEDVASESQMHEQFAAERILGEWFRPSVELLADIFWYGLDFDFWETAA